MDPLLDQLDFAAGKPPLPDGFSDEIYEISRNITTSDIASQVYDKLQPLLKKYRADRKLAIACGLLIERQRKETEMRQVWDRLQTLFPDDAMALRMLMRWYRREGRTEDGLAHIARAYPDCYRDVDQAMNALLGLSELKAWEEIDAVMRPLLKAYPAHRPVRMAYIKALAEQMRFGEAALLSRQVANRERMGAASQALLKSVERKADLLEVCGRDSPAELIEDMLTLAGSPRPFTGAERIVFFTGQLGTGGAERQLSRLACAYRERAGRVFSRGPEPQVWVRHANPETGADFYRPMLEKAGVPTRVLMEEAEVPIASLDGVPDTLKELLEMLAPDLRRHVGQLITMFLEHRTDVAYLWQDGGIMQSAIAAVIAGVPRIVTSFRGLPPNLRPHLYRDELPVLYHALARLPHVSFTANSQKTATAYEDWLSLAPGTVAVIPNASPPVLPDGDASDHRLWNDIVTASARCSKTVLGVFRFDDNKRPLQWIETAVRYLEERDDTRFVMLGDGQLFTSCARLIRDCGLSNRIFLAGIRSNVGFYIHRADLVMHLARMEGLPNVLIEAQLAGKPVLATPAGGTDEVVVDGQTGILLSDAETLPRDELDRELAAILTDPPRRARLGGAAMTHSGERFSTKTVLARTTELFNALERGKR